jgi:hypothetical protein
VVIRDPFDAIGEFGVISATPWQYVNVFERDRDA